MALLTNTRRKLAATVVAGATLAGGAGVAYAATSTSTPAPAPATAAPAKTPAAHTGRHNRAHELSARSILARADYATVEVKRDGHWVTYTFNRGKVTAASPTSITLDRPDGQSVTIPLNTSTKYRGETSATALVKDRDAMVTSTGGVATSVIQRTGKHVAATAPATSAS